VGSFLSIFRVPKLIVYSVRKPSNNISMNNQRGFTMIQALIGGAMVAIVALMATTAHQNQVKGQNFVEFHGKAESIRSAIIGQFLSTNDNCKCFFASAAQFPATGVGQLSATPPTSIGRMNFPTPGSCAGSTIPNPITSQAGIDGVKALSFQLAGITPVSGQYTAQLLVRLESMKEVLGPKEKLLKFPVTVKTSPGAGANVVFEGCSSSEISFTAPDPNMQPGPIAFTTSCRHGILCDPQAQQLCAAHFNGAPYCVKDIYGTKADGGDKNIGVEGYTCKPELCSNGTNTDFTVTNQMEGG
jgi:type II secretory pathway pseudopilin PulG